MSPTEYQELVTRPLRRAALDRDMNELRRRVIELESRVDQIQRRLPS